MTSPEVRIKGIIIKQFSDIIIKIMKPHYFMCTVGRAFTSIKKVVDLITFLSQLADIYSLHEKSCIFNISLFF
jgi:hypothetical protein